MRWTNVLIIVYLICCGADVWDEIDKRASPLPQAANIRVSGVQRVAETNQQVKKQQGGRALQRWHGPEGN